MKLVQLAIKMHLTIKVDLPIHIADGPTAVVQFTGAGFDSRIMGKSMSYSDLQLPEVPSKDTEKLRIPFEVHRMFWQFFMNLVGFDVDIKSVNLLANQIRSFAAYLCNFVEPRTSSSFQKFELSHLGFIVKI